MSFQGLPAVLFIMTFAESSSSPSSSREPDLQLKRLSAFFYAGDVVSLCACIFLHSVCVFVFVFVCLVIRVCVCVSVFACKCIMRFFKKRNTRWNKILNGTKKRFGVGCVLRCQKAGKDVDRREVTRYI